MTLIADNNGVMAGKFTVPAGIPAGNKRVTFVGVGGSYGEMIFSGQGTLQRDQYRQETTVTETRWQSPPPPPPPDPDPPPPEPVPSEEWSITASTGQVDEGQSVTFSIAGKYVIGTGPFSYKINGISADDLSSGSLSGSFSLSNSQATVTVGIKADSLTEGDENISLVLGNGVSATAVVKDTSRTPDPAPTPGYSVSKSTSSVDEGQSVTFSITTTNVQNGTVIPYTISGVSAADLSAGSLSGSVTINSNAASVTVTLAADTLTEGLETLQFSLNGLAYASVTVHDTSHSPVPTYTVTSSVVSSDAIASVNEGGSVTFIVNTTNVADGTALPYTLSGVALDRLTVSSLTGTVSISSGRATVPVGVKANSATDGSSILTFTLDGKNAATNVVVNDSSREIQYSVESMAAGTPNAGSTVKFRIKAPVPDGTVVTYSWWQTGATSENFSTAMASAKRGTVTMMSGEAIVSIQTTGQTHRAYVFVLSDSIGTAAGAFAGVRVSQLIHDPLAQTFTLEKACQLSGVELWFAAVGDTPVRIDLREVQSGVPTRNIIASTTHKPAELSLNGATRFSFERPVQLQGGVEYAIVVLCNDDVSALSIAELGKYDATAQRWITSQPYTVGVLLSSSNASTWTAHQDRDMAFRLLGAAYSETERIIDLGNVAITDATDLLLMNYAERPTSATRCDYLLTLPDGETVTVSDGQPLRLPAAATGKVGIKARLRGTADASPVLLAGTQLAAGKVASSATYVSRAVPAGSNVRVKVVYEALIPSGAGVAVDHKGVDAADTWAHTPLSTSSQVGDGWMEFVHEAIGISESAVQARLTLTGTSAARPRVRKLRVIVM